jgi:hypothetical protein
LFDNIDIISNRFIWNEKWFAIWYKKPVIHVFNKDETVLKNFKDVYNKIKTRKNVILLWDSQWDPHMIKWFNYKNLLKIWFLNNEEEELLEEYKKIYDIIITWDWKFNFVNDILKDIILKKIKEK